MIEGVDYLLVFPWQRTRNEGQTQRTPKQVKSGMGRTEGSPVSRGDERGEDHDSLYRDGVGTSSVEEDTKTLSRAEM